MLNRNSKAIAVYDRVISSFGTASETFFRVKVAEALIDKGGCLGQLNRKDEEIDMYDEVISSFDNAPESALRELVAEAIAKKSQK